MLQLPFRILPYKWRIDGSKGRCSNVKVQSEEYGVRKRAEVDTDQLFN